MKKLLCVLLSLVLLALISVTPSFAAGGGMGDVDRDGKRTAADARLVLRAAVGLEDFAPDSVEFLASDINHDGKLTADDARTTLRTAVALDTLPEIIASPAAAVSFVGPPAPGLPVTYVRQNDREVYNANLSRYETLMNKAGAETDLDRRYVLYAEAESYLLDSAVLIPTYTSGGNYVLSHIAPHTVPFVKWGSDDDRLSKTVITNELIKKADYDALLALWEDAKNGKGDYSPREYLASHGYTFSNAYATTFTAGLKTLDWLSTASSTDTQILVNTVDGLLQYDNLGRLRPALAQSWEVSPDGTVYTFNLRRSASWVTSDGEVYAPLTANDFVFSFQYMLRRAAGLEWLVTDVVKGAADYVYNNGGFDGVGCKALDDYTLQITLEEPTPYFSTMLGYSCFFPVCQKFYESKGGFDFEHNPSDPASQVYCGPYRITSITPEEIVLTKNDRYYNAYETVTHELVWTHDDGSATAEEVIDRVKSGALSGVGLNGYMLEITRADGTFETYAHLSDTTSTTNVGGLNLNRGKFSNGAVFTQKFEDQKIATAAALNNKNFRKALAYAFDKAAYNAVSHGEELAESSLRNMYCDPNLVVLSEDVTDDYGTTFKTGTAYGDLVQHYCDRLGLGVDVSDGVNGWYNPERAREYLAAAKAELGEGLTWPITISVVYYTRSESNTRQAEAIKASIEGALGEDNVYVYLVGAEEISDYYSAGYYVNTGADLNADFFCGSGWGPDYGDPSTYLDTFRPDGRGYLTKIIGLF